jgi:predicted deacylase
MRILEMLPKRHGKSKKNIEPVVARSSSWIRASESGILRALIPLGGRVKKGTLLGVVADPFGEQEIQIIAPFNGIIIGRTNLPLVNEGDAIYHIARFGDVGEVEAIVDEFHDEYTPDLISTPNTESPII